VFASTPASYLSEAVQSSHHQPEEGAEYLQGQSTGEEHQRHVVLTSSEYLQVPCLLVLLDHTDLQNLHRAIVFILYVQLFVCLRRYASGFTAIVQLLTVQRHT
jgi:hypothetical protein